MTVQIACTRPSWWWGLLQISCTHVTCLNASQDHWHVATCGQCGICVYSLSFHALTLHGLKFDSWPEQCILFEESFVLFFLPYSLFWTWPDSVNLTLHKNDISIQIFLFHCEIAWVFLSERGSQCLSLCPCCGCCFLSFAELVKEQHVFLWRNQPVCSLVAWALLSTGHFHSATCLTCFVNPKIPSAARYRKL